MSNNIAISIVDSITAFSMFRGELIEMIKISDTADKKEFEVLFGVINKSIENKIDKDNTLKYNFTVFEDKVRGAITGTFKKEIVEYKYFTINKVTTSDSNIAKYLYIFNSDTSYTIEFDKTLNPGFNTLLDGLPEELTLCDGMGFDIIIKDKAYQTLGKMKIKNNDVVRKY